MIQVSPARVGAGIGMLCALLAWMAPRPVSAQLLNQLTLEDLSQKSDMIFTATCTARKSEPVNGRVYTRYTLHAPEFIKGEALAKGSGPVTLSSTNDLEFVESGGQLDGDVPLGQYVPGMADIKKGEEVLLFCGVPKASAQASLSATNAGKGAKASPLANTPYIMGKWQGRYTVMRDPESGDKLLVRATVTQAAASAMNANLQEKIIEHNKLMAAKKAAAGQSRAQAKADVKADAPVSPAELKEQMLKAQEAAGQALAEARAKDSKLKTLTRQAKAKQAALAKADPEAAANQIQQFESLSAVKERIQKFIQADPAPAQ